MRVHKLPDFLTVEETAQVLRIGRTTAYAEVRHFHVTHGREGIPSVRSGRSLRIPPVRAPAPDRRRHRWSCRRERA